MRSHLHKTLLAFGLSLFAGVSLADNPGASHAPAPASEGQPEVLMYVMPNCGYCAKAREHLTSISVHWRELDISATKEAQDAFTKHGGQGTPLILIGDDRIAGYDVATLDRALAKHGLIKQ